MIAIIALLLTVLIPALRKARASAQSAACGAHLHQIAVALEAYEMQYDHKRFAVRNNGSASEMNLYWMGKLARFLGDEEYRKSYQKGETIDVLLCPSAPASRFVQDYRNNDSGQWGTQDRPWEWDRTGGQTGLSTLGSLTINGWVVYDYLYDGTAALNQYGFKNWDSIRPEVPLFGDGLWTIGWPLGGENYITDDPAPPDLYVCRTNYNDLDSQPGEPRHMWRFCINRHSRKVNLIFKDLHVEAIGLANLWYLPWHRNYEYPTTSILLPSH